MLLVLSLLTAQAAPFGTVPVTGYLTDLSGVPVNVDTPMELRLYTTDPATPLWQDAVTVTVDRGVFRVLLGEGTPLDLATFQGLPDVHLEIRVDGDTLDPIPVGDVPAAAYAANAGDVATLQGQPASDFLPATYVPDFTELTGRPAGFDDGDDNTLYAAGSGLTLAAGNALTVDSGTVGALAHGVCFDTEAELTALLDDDYLDGGSVSDFSTVTGVPAEWADGDDDTTYTAGTGLTLTSTSFVLQTNHVEIRTRAVTYDTESELTAALDDNYYAASRNPAWAEVNGVPASWADGVDDDTTYNAGAGVVRSGTQLSLNTAEATATAENVTFHTEAELRAVLDDNYLSSSAQPAWSSVTGKPASWADNIDNDTTYGANSGMVMSGTTLSIDNATVTTSARGATYDTDSELTAVLNDNYTPEMVGVGGRPYVGQFTYDLANTRYIYDRPGGIQDTMSVAGLTPGERRVSDLGYMVLEYNGAGTADSRLHFDIDNAPSIACLWLHHEDDEPLPGFYIATDVGNQWGSIWGDTNTGTLSLVRRGDDRLIVNVNNQVRFICF
jgi:hypothetical protein